jgi:hypothetical protein
VNGINGGIALAILAVFLIGVAIGVVAITAVASKREDRAGSITGPAPDATTEGARHVCGFGSRNVTPHSAGWQGADADDLVTSDWQGRLR